MKPLLLFFAFLVSTFHHYYSQGPIFIKDSILAEYKKSGYANEHFRFEPKTKEPKQGKWQFYEVRNYTTTVLKDGLPAHLSGEFLLYVEGEYLNGKREGKWSFYVIEDKYFRKILSRRCIYSKGILVDHVKCYLPNGKLSEICPVQNGLLEGESTLYFPDGKVYVKIPYKADKFNGVVHYYSPDGKLHRTETYTSGILTGEFISYYPNGEIKSKHTNIQGKIEGIYQYYYPSGKLWTKRLYHNDLLMTIYFTYDKNGRELDKGKMKQGNGYVKYYDKDGVLTLIRTYKDGIVVKEENK
jgi:antitoxin component YwqK of YwqJK toxin-antitoxin module